MKVKVTEVSLVPLSARSVTVPGFVATGFVTVTAAVPCTVSLVAEIVAVPPAIPVTRPLADTVAAAELLDAQVMVRPDSAAPVLSLRVAVSCCVLPTVTLAVAGVSVTDATGIILAAVVALATFERSPNTASTFNVPRNATS